MRDFNHTVNVLVKAFLNGTLIHTDACGCAAGNIKNEFNKQEEKFYKTL